MVQKIIWSSSAQITFEEAINYLGEYFSEKEVQKFADRVLQKLLLIQSAPGLGTKGARKPNVYKTVIHKRILLYYQYKPVKKEVFLLVFWNTLQNPSKVKY